MNSLRHSMCTFNRFELKYLITLKQAEKIKCALGAYLVVDEHASSNGHYTLASLYYDSPGLRCYRENLDGIKTRRKLRIRHYETNGVLTEQTPVFLEIKQRVDRVTQKRRAILPYSEALRLCNDRQMPDHAADDKAILEEIYVFLWQYNMRPASIVRYDRQAFAGTDHNPGLRVTFDTSLSFQAHQLHLHEPPTGLPLLPPAKVIMEVKVNERIPLWLTELIAAHNLQLIGMSKYCRSIQAAQGMPTTRRHRLAAECAQDVLASSLSTFSTLEQRMGIRRQEETDKMEATRGNLQHH
jgi:hypothetical protein